MYSGALLLRFGWKFEQKEIAPNTYVKYTERAQPSLQYFRMIEKLSNRKQKEGSKLAQKKFFDGQYMVKKKTLFYIIAWQFSHYQTMQCVKIGHQRTGIQFVRCQMYKLKSI